MLPIETTVESAQDIMHPGSVQLFMVAHHPPKLANRLAFVALQIFTIASVFNTANDPSIYLALLDLAHRRFDLYLWLYDSVQQRSE